MALHRQAERQVPRAVPGPNGRQRSRTFRRKADADRFAREIEVDMDRGQWIDPRGADVPLEQWAETFMPFARSLAPTTQQTYRRDLWTYVLPRFGSVRLGRLSPEEIETWLNDELANGLAPSSVHRHYRTLRRVLQTAVEKDRLLSNPCDRVRPPKVPRTEMAVLTWEQATALAEAHTERYRTLIYVAIDTGMRWSELVGLRRGRVDVVASEDPSGRAADPARRRLVGSAAAEDRLGNAHCHGLRCRRGDAGRSPQPLCLARTRLTHVRQRRSRRQLLPGWRLWV